MFHSGNEMIDPSVLFEKAQLQPGAHAADLGCGQTGHIVFPAAQVIGETGVMYAVDIIKDVLEQIHKRAASAGLLNVHTVWADLEQVGKTAIPAHSLDVAFLVNTLVQSNNRTAMLDEAARFLKDKSRFVIVDWARKGLAFGPPDDRFVHFDEIKQWAAAHGFVVQEEFDMGRFHRGMVLFRHE